MNNYDFYQMLDKPFFAPPAFIFGPVWSVLYVLIIISFGFVFYQVFKRRYSFILAAPFLLNLFFNFIFTPIQFGCQNNFLASLDILLVLITLIWAMVAIYSHIKWIAIVNFPYLLWVLYATVLQLSITFLNWD